MSSICSKCAKDKKLTWPKGHLATYWTGECSYCKEIKGVCDLYDYDGPHMNDIKNINDVRD